ncbi:MAG: putative phage abortive infection protein [Bacteroidia bacterium]|jgi:hypothetical protein|nr:putative phage abortive infection protein [Bacteroidia bacterium]
MDRKKKRIKFDRLSKKILFVSLILIIIAFISPIIFTKIHTGIEFNGYTGVIGDTIGGIMNPFIAIAGILVTFLAFYIQFEANKQQRILFRKEFNQNKKALIHSKFENQFYEMLRLHKENVNEISITETINYIKRGRNSGHSSITTDKIYNVISGREVFQYFKVEFEILFYLAKTNCVSREPKIWVNEAYAVFFHGLQNDNINKNVFFQKVSKEKENHYEDGFGETKYLKIGNKKTRLELRFDIFNGHSSQLAHYYRHLFQTVKYITKQSDDLITYEEKRNYLRILRSQLSNEEQAMLFYNWLSGFGKNWENNSNKFFTDYRMIHNIYQELIVDEIVLESIFDTNRNYLKEENREFDPLFEYQDWERDKLDS